MGGGAGKAESPPDTAAVLRGPDPRWRLKSSHETRRLEFCDEGALTRLHLKGARQRLWATLQLFQAETFRHPPPLPAKGPIRFRTGLLGGLERRCWDPVLFAGDEDEALGFEAEEGKGVIIKVISPRALFKMHHIAFSHLGIRL